MANDTQIRSPVTQLWFQEQAKGTAQKGVYLKTLSQMPFVIAPLSEQRRIVAKIETLQERSRKARAALEAIPPLLEQFRQSVLAAAFRGDLTADWRAQHPDVEPASVLLDRIRAERRRRWEEAELSKMQAKGKMPKDEKWKERYKEPEPVDETDLPELPGGWCWARVDEVGDVQLGRQRAPKYHQGPHMRPYLRVMNVYEDRIDISDIMEMDFSPEEYEIYRLGYGDILLDEGQSLELIGRPAMYRDELPGACFTNTLVRFRAERELQPEYALAVFRSYMHTGRFQSIASQTTNIAHLGAGRFAELEFPLPPVDEQIEIVRILNKHLAQIFNTASFLKDSVNQLATLDQSILAKAFRGELVPQDPNDEPASALLERIRAEREAQSAKPRAKKKTPGSTKHTKKAPPVSVNENDDLPLFNSLQK